MSIVCFEKVPSLIVPLFDQTLTQLPCVFFTEAYAWSHVLLSTPSCFMYSRFQFPEQDAQFMTGDVAQKVELMDP